MPDSREDGGGKPRLILEVAAMSVAIAAAGFAAWQAYAADQSLELQRAANRQATADQVLILGPAVPIGVSGGSGSSGSWSALEDSPSTIQNYGRLPVTDVVVELNFGIGTDSPATYLVRIGPLQPCQQVSILETTPFLIYDIAKTKLSVHFTDPAGQAWIRGTSGPPRDDIDGIPETNDNRGSLERSEITTIPTCG